MTTLLVGCLVVGFGVSVYLLYTMGPARPGDTKWDRIVFYPELWVFAVMLWPLYVAIRVLRSRRGQSGEARPSWEGAARGPFDREQCHTAKEEGR